MKWNVRELGSKWSSNYGKPWPPFSDGACPTRVKDFEGHRSGTLEDDLSIPAGQWSISNAEDQVPGSDPISNGITSGMHQSNSLRYKSDVGFRLRKRGARRLPPPCSVSHKCPCRAAKVEGRSSRLLSYIGSPRFVKTLSSTIKD